jgi:hypothetical protein
VITTVVIVNVERHGILLFAGRCSRSFLLGNPSGFMSVAVDASGGLGVGGFGRQSAPFFWAGAVTESVLLSSLLSSLLPSLLPSLL